MKVCIDCIHHVTGTDQGGDPLNQCKATATVQIDAVTGDSTYKGLEPCQIMRREGQPCGPEAKLYEESQGFFVGLRRALQGRPRSAAPSNPAA